jgi:outer membrane lipoprotein-sorting protein
MKIQIILWAFLIAPIPLWGQDAREIIRKAELNRLGDAATYSEMTMTIQRPDWSREMGTKAWSKGQDYSLMLITSPARDAGTAFLKRENELWNWQPTIERTIKMPPSMMSQSWMGSDFSNEDLVRQISLVEDYEHTYLGEESIQDRMTYKIQLVPKPDVPVVYSKIISWIDQERYVEVKSEAFDEDDELVQTVTGEEVKKIQGYWVPTKMTVQPADEPDHLTIIQQMKVDYDVSIAPRFFSIQNMKSID